ncbi:hypothetical protein HX792_20590 [Pseudomonas sp. B6002]|uniref:hypothetical protein n=1 Tax=Pseudomonas sp. B6002 TaxID=2726978 RepID=UPI0015A37FF3|nr:hypothetical protein [Pseudomonas sp. B6002]NVZ52755.1 hypothetical protein [Pseudomonas sp. B6002]
MQRMVCSVLSLAMIMSSLGGCAAKPVKPAVVGPEVYGYTLYQPLTGEQLDDFSRTTKSFPGGLSLYLKASEGGGVLGLYADASHWLDTVSKTSKPLATEPECQAAQQVEDGQLKALVEGYNAHASGDFVAIRAVDDCKLVPEQGYRYTVWATMQARNLAPVDPHKLEVRTTYAEAVATGALAAVVVVVVVAAVVLTKGNGNSSCSSASTAEERKKECDKKDEPRRAQEREKDQARERLEKGYGPAS